MLWGYAFAAARDARRGYANREGHMAVDGNWNITMDTPMGQRSSTLTLKAAGGKLEGRAVAEEGSADIFDGTVDGNNVAWKIAITQPMAMTLEFSGAVDGDGISGSVKLGMFGNA